MLRKTIGLFSRIPVKQESIARSFSIFKQNNIESDLALVIEKAGEDIQEANQFAQNNILNKVPVVEANLICNRLLTEDLAFRKKCEEMVTKQMAKTTPSVAWKPFSEQNILTPAFRSVVPCGNYGVPEYIFQNGMPAAIFNMRPYRNPLSQAGIVSYVASQQPGGGVEAMLSSRNRHDVLGVTFGPLVAMSLNIAYCADQRYILTPSARFQVDNYLYLFAVDSGYSVAEAIYQGSGYTRNRDKGLLGEKGVSDAEDSREVTPGVYVPSQRILGCRIVKTTGELGPFIPNPSANVDEFVKMAQFIDVQIFLEAKRVADIRVMEAAIYPSVVRNHEDASLRMNEVNAQNKELQRQIQREAIARRERLPMVSNLLRQQYADHKAGFCDHSFHLFATSQRLIHAKNNGTMLDSKDSYDDSKAKSEEELKEKVINQQRFAK